MRWTKDSTSAATCTRIVFCFVSCLTPDFMPTEYNAVIYSSSKTFAGVCGVPVLRLLFYPVSDNEQLAAHYFNSAHQN